MSEISKSRDYLSKGIYVSPFESLIAGSISGASARALTAPLDTIKIRLQLSSIRSGGISGFSLVKSLIINEGIFALWKGNVPAGALYVLYGASQFTSYSIINNGLSNLQDQSQYSLKKSTHSMLVGACTGLISTLVTYPFDLLRTRLAAHESRNLLSMRAVCKSIYSSDGARGFFVGVYPSLFSVVTSSGIFFWSYSLAKDAVYQFNQASPYRIKGREATSGFVAGITAKIITFPLDTLRKRMQVTKDERALRMFINHWHLYGFVNFYKGFSVSLIKTAPTSAVSIAVYEYTVDLMRRT